MTLKSRLPGLRSFLRLVLFVVAVEIAGSSGSFYVTKGLEWYNNLAGIGFAPPGSFIGLVWTVLFALIGVALWRIWENYSLEDLKVRTAFFVFVVHFIFNIGWSAAFFGAESTAAGLAVISLLLVLIVATIRAFYRVDRKAAYLLVPYILWVVFAAGLNLRFFLLN